MYFLGFVANYLLFTYKWGVDLTLLGLSTSHTNKKHEVRNRTRYHPSIITKVTYLLPIVPHIDELVPFQFPGRTGLASTHKVHMVSPRITVLVSPGKHFTFFPGVDRPLLTFLRPEALVFPEKCSFFLGVKPTSSEYGPCSELLDLSPI